MATGIYTGVDGVARKVKTPYRGVDGVARKVKTSYIGVDGVARKCFSGVEYVTWRKYKATTTYSYSYTEITPSGTTDTLDYQNATSTWTVGTGYSFSASSGYSLTGSKSVTTPNLVGYYQRLSAQLIYQFTEVTANATNSNFYTVKRKQVATCNQNATPNGYTYYSSDYVGDVVAEKGTYPDGGTYVAGYENATLYLRVNGTVYAYVKQSQ